MKDIDKRLDEILDKHATYYIQQTVKFFQENGESPELSKNNTGEIEAKQSIKSLISDCIDEVIGKKWRESDGWDFAFSDECQNCCAGDDFADCVNYSIKLQHQRKDKLLGRVE